MSSVLSRFVLSSAILFVSAASARPSEGAPSKHVVVAKFVDLGTVDVGAPGQQYWHDAQADVDQLLAGTLKGRVRLSYTVQTLPPSIAEAPPVTGQALILFVHGDRVVKRLPATTANVAATKAALARKSP